MASEEWYQYPLDLHFPEQRGAGQPVRTGPYETRSDSHEREGWQIEAQRRDAAREGECGGFRYRSFKEREAYVGIERRGEE